MELERSSRLVRWAYFYKDSDIPNSTSVCAFFWRAFVLAPLSWLFLITICLVGIAVIAGFVALVWHNLKEFVLTVGLGLLIMVVVWLISVLVTVDWKDVTPTSIRNSTFIKGVTAIKNKFCPIIYIR